MPVFISVWDSLAELVQLDEAVNAGDGSPANGRPNRIPAIAERLSG